MDIDEAWEKYAVSAIEFDVRAAGKVLSDEDDLIIRNHQIDIAEVVVLLLRFVESDDPIRLAEYCCCHDLPAMRCFS